MAETITNARTEFTSKVAEEAFRAALSMQAMANIESFVEEYSLDIVNALELTLTYASRTGEEYYIDVARVIAGSLEEHPEAAMTDLARLDRIARSASMIGIHGISSMIRTATSPTRPDSGHRSVGEEDQVGDRFISHIITDQSDGQRLLGVLWSMVFRDVDD